MNIIFGWLTVVTIATSCITSALTRKSRSDPLNDIPDIPVKAAQELCRTVTESGVPRNSKFLMAVVKNPVNSLGRSFPILPPRFYPGCYNWRWTKCFGDSYYPLADQCGVFSPVRIESDECGHVIKTDLPPEKDYKTGPKSQSCPCDWPCIPFFDPIQRCTRSKVKREDKGSTADLNSWPIKSFYLDHTQAAQLCLAMERSKPDRSFQLRFVPVPLATNDKVEELTEGCIQWMWLPCNGSTKQSEPDLENSLGKRTSQPQEKESKCKRQKCNIWKKIVKPSSVCEAFKDSSLPAGVGDEEGSIQHGAASLANASADNRVTTTRDPNSGRRTLCMSPEYNDSKLCRLVAQSLGYDLVNARPIINRKIRVRSIIQCNWFSETVFCTIVPRSLPAERSARRQRFTRRLKRHDNYRYLLHGVTRLKRQVIIKAEVQDQSQYEDTDEASKTDLEIENPSAGGIVGQVYNEKQDPIQEQSVDDETYMESGSRESRAFTSDKWNISVVKGGGTETATMSIDDEETDTDLEGGDKGVAEVTPEDLKRLLSYASSSVRNQLRAYVAQLLDKNNAEGDSVTNFSDDEAPVARASRKTDSGGLSIEKALSERGTNKERLNVYIDFPTKRVGTDKKHFYLDFPSNENGGGPGNGNLPEEGSNEGTMALRKPRPCGIFGCFPVQTVSKDVADKLDSEEPAEHPEKGGFVACGFENGKPVCKFRMITSHKHGH